MTSIKFGTESWKAVFARDFTFANCRVVSQAIATYLTGQNLTRKGLIIAYDHRFMAEEFARECARIMVGNGIRVFFMRKATPAPLAGFAVRHLEAGGALMVTGSHYATEYCGIKFFPSYAGPALPDITGVLEQEVERIGTSGRLYELDLYEAEKLDLYKEVDLDRVYMDALKRLVKSDTFEGHSLKVVVDPMFGSGVGYLEKILQELGCEVKTIHNYRDPLFGGNPPAPSENNLSALKNAVLSYQADIGLAMDGDASRFGIIDHGGKYLEPNQYLAICLDYLLKTRPTRGAVARTRATSHLIDRVARKHGLELFETPIGFKYLSQDLREHSCMIAGDQTGQLGINSHLPAPDAVLAGLLVVEMLINQKQTIKQLVDQFKIEYGSLAYLREDLPIETKNKDDIEEKLAQCQVKNLADLKVISCDFKQDLKILMDNGYWVLVRTSDLGNILSICIEGEKQEQVELIKDALLDRFNLQSASK